MQEQRAKGTIVPYIDEKGFGFISAAGGRGREVYFSWRDLKPDFVPRRGQVVNYLFTLTARGPRALDVIVEDEILPKQRGTNGTAPRRPLY